MVNESISKFEDIKIRIVYMLKKMTKCGNENKNAIFQVKKDIIPEPSMNSSTFNLCQRCGVHK